MKCKSTRQERRRKNRHAAQRALTRRLAKDIALRTGTDEDYVFDRMKLASSPHDIVSGRFGQYYVFAKHGVIVEVNFEG